ncbi:MAG: hypothetical protein GXP31_06805 [Kiritimatiellaeota bacterium]|nr:hypothetical protein [Kiritimatiellota bacterium]
MICVGMSVLLTGCGRTPAVRYDPIPGQILREALDALARGDDPQALKLLERLRDVYPETPLPDTGIRYVRERQFERRLNVLLRAGRLDDAKSLLDDWETRFGRSPLIARSERVIAGLRVLRKVSRQRPYSTSAELDAALKTVREFAVVLQSPAYNAWTARLERRLEKLRVEEKRRALERLSVAYDRAVVESPRIALERLAEIRRLSPDNAAVVLDRRVAGGDFTGLREWVRGIFGSRQPVECRSLEAGLCRNWDRLPSAVRRDISRLLFSVEPSDGTSISGTWLRGRLALEAGRRVESARLTRQVCGAVLPATEQLALRVSRLVMPVEQFQARPWRTPLPTITDLLDGLRQVRGVLRRRGAVP